MRISKQARGRSSPGPRPQSAPPGDAWGRSWDTRCPGNLWFRRCLGVSVLGVALFVVPGCQTTPTGPAEVEELEAAQRASAMEDWAEAAGLWSEIALRAEAGGVSEPCCRAAEAFIALRDLESAQGIVDLGLDRLPEDADLLETKARILVLGGFRRAGAEFYARAVQVDSDRSSAHRELGRLRLELGQERAAVDALDQCIRLGIADSEVYGMRAMAHRAQRHWGRAVADYRAAYELGLDNLEMLVAAGSLYLVPELRGIDASTEEAARRCLERAVSIDPQCTRGHLILGILNQDQGKHSLAMQHFRRAVETDPGDVKALASLARLHGELDERGKARHIAALAFEQDPDDETRRQLETMLEDLDRRDQEEATSHDGPPDR